MILGGAAALLLMLFAPEPTAAQGEQFAQVTIRHHMIVRMSRTPRPPQRGQQLEWRESRGPRCIRAGEVAGAVRLGRSHVDLVMQDRSRMRVQLENSCPALDYYLGFYVNANEDGQICADRDVIRSRMGGECEIERFRALRPVPRE